MKVQINSNSLEVDTGSIKVFKELVSEIEKKYIDPEHVITNIILNGAELDSLEEEDQAELPLNRLRNLNIKTQNKKELALQALEDAKSIVPEMLKVLKSAVAHFENGADKLGMKDFIILADGLSWLSSSYHGTEAIFREKIKENNLDSEPFLVACHKISRLTVELLEAQKRSDITTFRDILEYELDSLLKDVVNSLAQFKETLLA